MIISHLNKFIWVHTGKAAGTSVNILLSSICGDKDITLGVGSDEKAKEIAEKLNIKLERNNYKKLYNSNPKQILKILKGEKVLDPKYKFHQGIGEIKSFLPKEEFENYFKFAILRNPYETLVSHYFWTRRGANLTELSFKDFINSNFKRIINNNRKIFMIDREIGVDKLLIYENLEAELNEVFEILKIDSNTINLLNKIQTKSHTRKKNETVEYMFKDLNKEKKEIQEYCDIEFKFGNSKNLK
jgi:hypothetical protein